MTRLHHLRLVAWLLVVLTTLAVGQSSADTSARPDVSEGTQPAPYCVPEAWQGGRAVTHGVLNSSGAATATQVCGKLKARVFY